MPPVQFPAYKVYEHWLGTGGPKEAWSKAGPWWMKIEKEKRGTWKGNTIGELPIRDQLNGNAGPNSRRAFANSGNIGGVRFRPPIREFHDFLIFDELDMDLLKDPAEQASRLGELQDSMLL